MDMPEVLREGNVIIRIYSNEGSGKAKEPVHCHVEIRGEGIMKVWLYEGVEIAGVDGRVKRRSINKAIDLVENNFDLIMNEWERIHGNS